MIRAVQPRSARCSASSSVPARRRADPTRPGSRSTTRRPPTRLQPRPLPAAHAGADRPQRQRRPPLAGQGERARAAAPRRRAAAIGTDDAVREHDWEGRDGLGVPIAGRGLPASRPASASRTATASSSRTTSPRGSTICSRSTTPARWSGSGGRSGISPPTSSARGRPWRPMPPNANLTHVNSVHELPRQPLVRRRRPALPARQHPDQRAQPRTRSTSSTRPQGGGLALRGRPRPPARSDHDPARLSRRGQHRLFNNGLAGPLRLPSSSVVEIDPGHRPGSVELSRAQLLLLDRRHAAESSPTAT